MGIFLGHTDFLLADITSMSQNPILSQYLTWLGNFNFTSVLLRDEFSLGKIVIEPNFHLVCQYLLITDGPSIIISKIGCWFYLLTPLPSAVPQSFTVTCYRKNLNSAEYARQYVNFQLVCGLCMMLARSSWADQKLTNCNGTQKSQSLTKSIFPAGIYIKKPFMRYWTWIAVPGYCPHAPALATPQTAKTAVHIPWIF